MDDFGALARRPDPQADLDDPTILGDLLRANMPPHSQACVHCLLGYIPCAEEHHRKRKELIESLPVLKQDDLERLGKKGE